MITLQSPMGLILCLTFFAKPWCCLAQRDTEGHFLYLASLKTYKVILYTIWFVSSRRFRILYQISIISFRFRSMDRKLLNFHTARIGLEQLEMKPYELVHTNHYYRWKGHVE